MGAADKRTSRLQQQAHGVAYFCANAEVNPRPIPKHLPRGVRWVLQRQKIGPRIRDSRRLSTSGMGRDGKIGGVVRRDRLWPDAKSNIRVPILRIAKDGQMMNRQRTFLGVVFGVLLIVASGASAREYHVSVTGDDAGDGSAEKPLKTISAAARLAQPGDVVTVHEGTYRERVTPPRGGLSDDRRIVYQAADGEKVEIKGSEVVEGWEKASGGVWKVTLPNTFFGDYNPYHDLIRGDWFNRMDRDHHTGDVYLGGVSLWEAARLEDVLESKDDRA